MKRRCVHRLPRLELLKVLNKSELRTTFAESGTTRSQPMLSSQARHALVVSIQTAPCMHVHLLSVCSLLCTRNALRHHNSRKFLPSFHRIYYGSEFFRKKTPHANSNSSRICWGVVYFVCFRRSVFLSDSKSKESEKTGNHAGVGNVHTSCQYQEFNLEFYQCR